MGLAASQARLLFITARQNDVSAQMQRISNQTLTLARDEEEVSSTYNQMLSAAESTSLVDNTTEVPTDLSYNNMMGAQGAETYTTPYIINNASDGNKVVLSPDMASKLSALGATSGSASDFTSKYPDVKEFIKAMAGSDIADAYTGSTGSTSTTPYSGKLSINELLGKVATASSADSSNQYSNNLKTSSLFGGQFVAGQSGVTSTAFNTLANNNSSINVFKESSEGITAYYGLTDSLPGYNSDWRNKRVTDVGKKTVSLSDLYSNAGNMSSSIMLGSAYRTSATTLPDLTNIKANLGDLTNNIGTQIVSALTALGYDAAAAQTTVQKSVASVYKDYSGNIYWDEGKGDGNVFDTSSKWKEARKSALAYAESKNYDGQSQEYWSNVFDDANQSHNEGAVTIGMMASTGLHGIVATRCDDEGGNNTWQFTLNLGNLVQDIVNGLMDSMSSGAVNDTDLNGDKTINQEKVVDIKLTKPSSSSSSTTTTTSSTGTTNAQKANYYAQIYNALAKYGWCVDASVNDASTLQEKLKNGTYYLNEKPASTNTSITSKVVTREDAEHYYDDEMRKINRKEKILDQQLTKLQTEYSALTNDYESVKSIINANVQKSFTYCQQG